MTLRDKTNALTIPFVHPNDILHQPYDAFLGQFSSCNKKETKIAKGKIVLRKHSLCVHIFLGSIK